MEFSFEKTHQKKKKKGIQQMDFTLKINVFNNICSVNSKHPKNISYVKQQKRKKHMTQKPPSVKHYTESRVLIIIMA